MPNSSGAFDPRTWRGRGASPDKPRAKSHRTFYAVLALFLVLAGVVTALIFWIRPVREPYFRGIWIDQYEDARIPFSAYAGQDREALLSLPWQDKNPFGSQQLRLLREELENLQTRGDRPVVVYLSAFAVRGDKDEVYVLPLDARLDDQRTWLPLRDVLRLLRACPSKYKFLLLDIMRPFTDPRRGLLDNDVAGAAWPMLQAAEEDDPHLLILTACSPGQVALAQEVAGRSLFAYYVERGLQGRADGYNDRRKRDGRVSAHELAAFVVARVDRWSRANRPARQTPALFGKVDDFPLVPNGESKEEPVDEAETESYPEYLLARWKLLEHWRNTAETRGSVTGYRQLQTALLDAEQHLRQGMGPKRIEDSLLSPSRQVEDEQKQLQAKLKSREPRSLAEAAAWGALLPDLSKGDALARLAKLQKSEPAPGAKVDEKELAKWQAAREEFLKPYADKPDNLACTVWQAAVEETRPRREQARFWGGLLTHAWRDLKGNRPRYPETEFLRRLSAWAAEVTAVWPTEAVRDAVQAVQEGQRAAVRDDDAAPWLRSSLAKADAQRQEGERRLFQREAASWQQALSPLRSALAEYERVNRGLRVLRQARQTRDEALALLPGYAGFLEREGSAMEDWFAAVRTARALEADLARPPGTDVPDLPKTLAALDDHTRTLRDSLNKLAQPFREDRLQTLISPTRRPSPAAWRDLDVLLACPALTADLRGKIWKAERELAGRLHRDTLALDDKEDTAGVPTAMPDRVDATAGRRDQRQNGLLRARVSIGMLQLAGLSDTTGLEDALERAKRDSHDAAAWNDLCRRLRQAWMEHGKLEH